MIGMLVQETWDWDAFVSWYQAHANQDDVADDSCCIF